MLAVLADKGELRLLGDKAAFWEDFVGVEKRLESWFDDCTRDVE